MLHGMAKTSRRAVPWRRLILVAAPVFLALMAGVLPAMAATPSRTSGPQTAITHYPSLAAAFNNHGVASDGTDAADIGPNRAGLGMSRQALTQAGFGPGQTVTVDAGTTSQATFLMPKYAVGAVDNVIADTQTIDLEKPTRKELIDLLMFSTCGSRQFSLQSAFTFIYADDELTDTTMPALTGWLQPAPATLPAGVTLAARLPYFDNGTTVDSTRHPHIYHVRVRDAAAEVGSPVVAVTLPNTRPIDSSCSGALLHVLATSFH